MFEIEYKGANAVIITTKKLRVVFDPNLEIVGGKNVSVNLSLIHISEPTRQAEISYAVFCLKKKKKKKYTH